MARPLVQTSPSRRAGTHPQTIAGAIVLAVILILVIANCRGNQKQAEYEDYMDSVSTVAAESEEIGKQLNNRLTTPGIKLEALRSDIEGLRDQQEQILRRTQELRPPGPLLEQQENLVETMQFRVNGLAGLARGLALVSQTSDPEQSGNDLADQAQRLVASDIVYLDAFKEASRAVLEQQGVTNVSIPSSVFVQNSELASPALWKLFVDRLTQGAEAGGLHGNGIEGVRVQPGGQALSASEDNDIEASDDLAFEVLVKNSGENQETQVQVTLVIRQEPLIKREQVIDVINPGDTTTVTFRDFPTLSFSTQTTLLVTVDPVPGEQNENNNRAQYSVIFTLG